MKYLKISFIILIFSIIIFSAANSKVIYVEEGSEEASKSKSKLLTDKVIYKIYNEYEINPIYCLAIFPFEFSKKTKATQQEKENLRKIFYAYISPLGIVDIELSRLNYLQKKYPRDSYAELTLREKCNSYFVGKIHTLKITTLGVFSKNSVGGTFSIYNAKTNKLVWSSSHVASSKAGKIPKTPIDLVLGAVAASKNISEEQVFRVYGDLARRITKTIPDYDLIPQAMFKKEEEIRFDRIDVDTMEVADTVYAQVVKQTAENSEKVIEAKTKQHEAEKTALAAIEEAFKAAQEESAAKQAAQESRRAAIAAKQAAVKQEVAATAKEEAAKAAQEKSVAKQAAQESAKQEAAAKEEAAKAAQEAAAAKQALQEARQAAIAAKQESAKQKAAAKEEAAKAAKAEQEEHQAVVKVANDFDKILKSNITLNEKINLIETFEKELNYNKKLKYAEFLITNSRYEDALLKLNNLKNISKNHYVFFLRSRAFSALQNYDQADKEIIQAIRLNQENYQYYNVLGFINSQNNKLERSLAAYAMAIEKNKDNAFAYFNTGIIYTILGSNEQAADYLYKAGLIYFEKGNQLDVMSVLKQLERMDNKTANSKLDSLKKITQF